MVMKGLFKMLDGNRNYLVVSTVPADGLAPLGARASAGTVMTKFGTHMYMQDQYLESEIQHNILLWNKQITLPNQSSYTHLTW